MVLSFPSVPSSPIPIRRGPGCWPGWPTENPPPIFGSAESGSQSDCSEMDWDLWAEVATEAGKMVHGRLVSSLPFSFYENRREDTGWFHR